VILPSHIGQYRILRKIGAGGMGLVYLGEHTLLRRRAAIKTLLPTVAANHEIVERFFNEARATSAIADPGVIQIFDFGYHVDGTAYIVMELLEGEALSARLDRFGQLPLGDALRFGRQIASSLGAAHARDIVHRDLKPENIFLVRDTEAQGGERTKIIDFGICKMGAGDPMLTEAGAMIGTPVYMSPEQCRGSGHVDHRSDVYAFGCLLFHLITGRPPFIGEASGELIVAHLQEPPPAASQFVPGLPEAVDALLASCLAKSPDERFASMEALGTALGELAVDAEAFAPTVMPSPPTVPLGRGFRSVFDANLAAAVGGSRFGATPRLRFSPPPPQRPSLEIIDDDDDFDDLEVVAPRRRRVVLAALACVLVVGAALGLALTPLVLGDDDDEQAAPATQAAALPIEASPSATAAPAAEPSEAPPPIAELPHPVAAAPSAAEASAAVAAADPAAAAEAAETAASAHAGQPPTRAADEPAAPRTESPAAQSGGSPAARSAESSAATSAIADAPAPRSHATAPHSKTVASAPRASRIVRPSPATLSGPVRSPSSAAASGPVRSPAQAASPLLATPPAAVSRTPAMPVLAPMTPSPSSSPAPSPPSSPTEDLYDSR